MIKYLLTLVICVLTVVSWGSSLVFGEKRIDLNLKGFELNESKVTKNRKTYYIYAVLPGSDIKFSISAEYNRQYTDSATLREKWWSIANKQSPLNKTNIKYYTQGKFAVVEWDFDSPSGSYKHINAYRAEDGVCMDVHMSCANSAMAGGQLTSMLDMDKVSDSTPDEMLLCGIALHRAKSYPEAIESLKAWQKNSQNADVKTSKYRMGIVALGIAYSFCGRLNEAREIFESALLKDPEYPLFHYNLACVFALQNKPSVMLEQLKLAKQFRSNLEPDVPLSNPANNSSFKRFLENPEFKEVCKDWPQ